MSLNSSVAGAWEYHSSGGVVKNTSISARDEHKLRRMWIYSGRRVGLVANTEVQTGTGSDACARGKDSSVFLFYCLLSVVISPYGQSAKWWLLLLT